MKSRTPIYFSLFFTFCILASLIVGSYQNISIPASKSMIYSSKQISFTDKEQKATNNDFLFEETETESETSVSLKLLTNILHYLTTFFQSEILKSTSYYSHFLDNKPAYPIYISVCNFRI